MCIIHYIKSHDDDYYCFTLHTINSIMFSDKNRSNNSKNIDHKTNFFILIYFITIRFSNDFTGFWGFGVLGFWL